MTDANQTGSDRHANVLAELPWYVNGTLSSPERSEIDRHLAECAACRAALSEEQRLYEAMGELDATEVVETRAWEDIRSQIGAETPVAAPIPARETRRSRGARRPQPRTRQLTVLTALAASIALVAVFLPVALSDRGSEGTFQTLTQPADLGGVLIRAKIDGSVGSARLDELAAEHRLELVDGPSETGVVTLRPMGGDVTEAEAVAEQLSGLPEVLFVTVRTP
ncbi:MAG: zf-HC2 domain-containing protein [Pseudomonadota bacterium]